jgi:predicted porin
MLGQKRIEFVAVSVAASLFVAVSGAAAADLGGNCCADLEERIAELEATTARKGNRKVSLSVYGELNRALLFWDDGTERNVYVVTNQTTKNRLGFEGNAAVTHDVTAGYNIEIEIWSAGSDFVDQSTVLEPPNFSRIGSGSDGLNTLVTRYANWWLESKSLGRVTVGRASNATDNIAEQDLSGSEAVAGSVESWNEGFFLTDKKTGLHVYQGFTQQGVVGELFRGNFDGGRGNLVRYDSPVLAGFLLSATWGWGQTEVEDKAIALRYAGEFSGFRINAGIGYHEGNIADTDALQFYGSTGLVALQDRKEVVGSASVLHVPTGLFLTAAGGSRDWPEHDDNPNVLDQIGESYYYLKGGVYQKFIPLGKTSIYGEYYHIWDMGFPSGQGIAFDPDNDDRTLNTVVTNCDARCNQDASVWGIGIVQHVDAAAMELYLAYRHYWADDLISIADSPPLNPNALPLHDVQFDAVMSGARIKF